MLNILIFITFTCTLITLGVILWSSRKNISTPEPELKPEPEPKKWLADKIAKRIIAHTTDDKSIQGLLTFVGDDSVLISGAVLLGETPTPMGGDVVIARDRISIVQITEGV